MRTWSASLNIRPEPVQSARFGGGRSFTDPRKRAYISQLKGMILDRIPQDWEKIKGAVQLDVMFVFPFRKKDLKRKCNKLWMIETPDRGNLLKPLEDAIKNHVIEDDSAICFGLVSKQRWRDVEDGKILIQVTALEEEIIE